MHAAAGSPAAGQHSASEVLSPSCRWPGRTASATPGGRAEHSCALWAGRSLGVEAAASCSGMGMEGGEMREVGDGPTPCHRLIGVLA